MLYLLYLQIAQILNWPDANFKEAEFGKWPKIVNTAAEVSIQQADLARS
jgi:hypothetical protein